MSSPRAEETIKGPHAEGEVRARGRDRDGAERVAVWDRYVRAFHWALVACFAASWITIENQWMIAHYATGMTLLGLLIFRLFWGFIGSDTARFGRFLVNPVRAIQYLRGLASGTSGRHEGHNPAGGYMVVVVLVALFAQTATGLFANNDLGFSGPLADLLRKETSDAVTLVHAWIFKGVVALVWIHVAAVLFYLLVKDENLIRPMLLGWKRRDELPKGAVVTVRHGVRGALAAAACLIIVALMLFA